MKTLLSHLTQIQSQADIYAETACAFYKNRENVRRTSHKNIRSTIYGYEEGRDCKKCAIGQACTAYNLKPWVKGLKLDSPASSFIDAYIRQKCQSLPFKTQKIWEYAKELQVPIWYVALKVAEHSRNTATSSVAAKMLEGYVRTISKNKNSPTIVNTETQLLASLLELQNEGAS